MTNYKKQGKQNRNAGVRFESKVRKDLESKGWIVSKWMNNVELWIESKMPEVKKVSEDKEKIRLAVKNNEKLKGKIVPAKRKYNPFNRALTIGTGFPDFIAVTFSDLEEYPYLDYNNERKGDKVVLEQQQFILVEAKRNGYLDKEEKAKCRFLENKGFDIYVAYEGKDDKDKRKTLVKYKKWL